MDAKAPVHPSCTGARTVGQRKCVALIASSEYKCLCVSKRHTLIFLQRKESRHTCVRAHTQARAALSL